MLAVWLALTVSASAETPPDAKQWHVLIEPKFMRPDVIVPIANAQHTVLAAGYLNGNDVVYFTKNNFAALGVTFEQFMEKSRGNTTAKTVKAEFVRNKKQVIEYARLSSENPLTATAVLSQDFLKPFADIFGPKVLVAIPNRYTIYVFPSLTRDYQDYAPMIIDAYRGSTYPVSLEVFEVSAEGLKAVGEYEEP